MRTVLPTLQRVCAVPCAQLPPNMAEQHLAGLPIYIFADAREAQLAGEATCSSASEYSNNGTLWKTELRFFSPEALDRQRNTAFIVTDCHGNDFVIGTYEKPYPIVSETKVIGKTKEQSGYSYEVTLASVAGLIPCYI